jgi:predicted enzyme related to lactoylglutathione lyase
MSTPSIVAVMVHVPSISEALAWYERVFPNALRSSIAEEEFEFLLVGEVRLELVLADQKVSSGPSGSVVYWQFQQFEEALQRFQAAGAKLYRGPMSIKDGQLMCQVQDPWSNCIGLRGPSSLSKSKSVMKQLPNPSVEKPRPGKPRRAPRVKR